MKRLSLLPAATLVVALATSAAWADHGYRGHDGPHRHGAYRSYGFGYGYGYGLPSYGYRADAFGDAAREVRAAHSRYGFNTHPRSFFNRPPYGYWGW